MGARFDDKSGNGKGVEFIPGSGRFGPGIPEAPNDGAPYERNSGAWIAADAPINARVNEAPVDGSIYGRKDGDWTKVTSGTGGTGGGIEEAPLDGRAYARQSMGGVPGWNLLDFSGFVQDESFPEFFKDELANYHVFIQQFYSDTILTDSDALQTAFDVISQAGIDVTIYFKPNGGKGTNGRYFIDRLVEYKGNGHVTLDGQGSLIRFIGSSACVRYTAKPQQSLNQLPDWFDVRDFNVQINGVGVNPFHWNMPYKSSRLFTTGGARDIRIAPFKSDDAATDTIDTCFRLTNTWFFRAESCYATQKPKQLGSLIAGSSFIRTEGKCIEFVQDYCQTAYFDKAVDVGWANIAAVDSAAFPASWLYGQRVTQSNGADGYLAQMQTIGGRARGIYRTNNIAFVTGPATWYTLDGAVGGTFNISGVTMGPRPPEAMHLLNCTHINCNYGIYAPIPDGALDQLSFVLVNISDGQIAAAVSVLYGRHMASLSVLGTTPAIYNPNTIMYDIASCAGVNFSANTFTPNGNANVTGIKLRDVQAFAVTGNTFLLCAVPTDTDNTCKDGTIAFNEGLGSGVLKNTGNRYGEISSRGIQLKGNGSIGMGVDIDDPTHQTWTPIVTSSSGVIGSYTTNARYVLCNGLISIVIAVVISNRGSASGQMKITVPPIMKLRAQIDAAMVGMNVTLGRPLYAIQSTDIYINGPNNTDVFADNAGAQGNYAYNISGTMPILVN